MEADRVHRGRGELVALAWTKLVVFIVWTARDAAAGWIVAGVALSLVAGAAQASGFDLHRHFNHNDLYHVIESVAIVAFYRGVRRMKDL